MKTTTSTIACLFLLIACIKTDPSSGKRMISGRDNKAVTPFEVDKELENKLLSETDRASAERILLKVEKTFNENPENEFNIIGNKAIVKRKINFLSFLFNLKLKSTIKKRSRINIGNIIKICFTFITIWV